MEGHGRASIFPGDGRSATHQGKREVFGLCCRCSCPAPLSLSLSLYMCFKHVPTTYLYNPVQYTIHYYCYFMVKPDQTSTLSYHKCDWQMTDCFVDHHVFNSWMPVLVSSLEAETTLFPKANFSELEGKSLAVSIYWRGVPPIEKKTCQSQEEHGRGAEEP